MCANRYGTARYIAPPLTPSSSRTVPTGPVQCAERHMCGPRVIMGGVSFGGVRTSARPQRAERVPVSGRSA